MVVGSIMQIAHLLPEVSSANASVRSISEILQSPEIEPTAAMLPPDPVIGSIRFENISFAYPGSDRSAVHELTLEIHSGEVLALVGESGGGKTTLLNLAILRNPRIVFLDEATSSLDSESEQELENTSREVSRLDTLISRGQAAGAPSRAWRP